jgi:hypothetical protein
VLLPEWKSCSFIITVLVLVLVLVLVPMFVFVDVVVVVVVVDVVVAAVFGSCRASTRCCTTRRRYWAARAWM